jgi:putative membrane protein
MDTPIKGKPVADLRDYLAEERTFLAWLRTGIGLMGFGFVAARFGLFVDQPHVVQSASGVQAGPDHGRYRRNRKSGSDALSGGRV